MTTTLHNRVTSVLACLGIGILIAVIVVVWIQVGQGAFKPPPRDHYNYTITLEENKEEEVRVTNGGSASVRTARKDNGKVFLETSHLENIGKPLDTEFVKPLKISPLPMHDNDLLYDQLHSNQVPDEKPLRHHSGHFRSKGAVVWDPHPEYEIVAFGKKIHLALAYDDKFVAPNLHIIHTMENYTERFRHDSKFSGCFYTGTVKGDPHSNVAVSLCNGMTGYIRTSDDSYFIEPVEKYHEDFERSILHRIKRMPHVAEENNNFDDTVTNKHEHCATAKQPTVITNPTGDHTISKRSILIDDIDTNRKYIPFESSSEFPSISPRRKVRDLTYRQPHYDQHSESHEYYIKTMVVADRLMLEYHKTRDDLTRYILTLMSHVALLFKDASIGSPISLTVVRIHILENQEFTGSTSEELLRMFCNWQKKVQEPHNVALLFTRLNICQNKTSSDCHTLGVAEVDSMCSQSSCAVVRDRGLSTSFVIAHELGHTLSMMHDEEDNCDEFHEANRSKNIMSKMIENDTKPWHWSNCSKQKLYDFLEDPRSSCLLKPPVENYITEKVSDQFPGELFKVDEQCELEFGLGSRLCNFMYNSQPPCRALWCTGEHASCKSLFVPWADGTACGIDSWCHRGECINQDRELLRPQDGAWGPWQDWGPCSRTCGGGITIRKRNCDSPPPVNGGMYCRGKAKDYMSCNIQTCAKERDFREVQCAAFNGKMLEKIPNLHKNTTWVPKYGIGSNDNYCKLFCRISMESSYYLLKDKVIDGTKCQLTGYDICVNGICRPGGCDNTLHSNKALDNCGVCGGDNSKCQEISGTFNVTTQYGYNHVVRIPKDSSNIKVWQRAYKNDKNDSNYLALRDGKTDTYILNGLKRISIFNKEIFFAGVTFNYSGSDSIIETITTTKNKKIEQDLVIEVLSVGKIRPPDITYQYTISKENAPRYSWELYGKQWSKCDSLCSGNQYRRPVCRDLIANKTMSDNYCSHIDLTGLHRQQPCNTHCKLEWFVMSKGACSAHCGIGQRKVNFGCLKVDTRYQRLEIITADVDANSRMPVDLRHCSRLVKPQPEYEVCEVTCDSTRWQYSEWSDCSKSCGGGYQTRQAQCVDANNNQILSNERCLDREKVIQQECSTVKCPMWSYGDWTPCSVTCGKGYRTRISYCHVGPQLYQARDCNEKEYQPIKEECDSGPCPYWYTSDWSSCSETCGEGFQYREVICTRTDMQKIDDELCLNILKPNATKSCFDQECEVIVPSHSRPLAQPFHSSSNSYNQDFHDDNSIVNSFSSKLPVSHWKSGKWSACSKSCGTGVQRRMVVCLNEFGQKQSEYLCDLDKPVDTSACNTHSCPYWNKGAWSLCNSMCEQQRQVSCQNSTGQLVEDLQCDQSRKPHHRQNCTVEECNIYKNNLYSVQRRRNHSRNHNPFHHNSQNNQNSQNNHNSQNGQNSQNSHNHNQKGHRNHQNNHNGHGRNHQKNNNGNGNQSVNGQNGHQSVNYNYNYNHNTNNNNGYKENVPRQYEWKTGNWSSCSNTCGRGNRTRHVYCKDIVNDVRLVDQYCAHLRRPNHVKNCEMARCDYTWLEGPWSPCSQTCGEGKKFRNVTCHKVLSGGFKDSIPISNQYYGSKYFCDIYRKPEDMSSCNDRNCNDLFFWNAEAWSTCTQPCGKKGKQTRRIFCVNRTGKKVKRKHCNMKQRPRRSRKCNQTKCLLNCKDVQQVQRTTKNKDYMLYVKGKVALVYCDKMDSHNPEEYISLKKPNFAEFYHKRLKDMHSCPYQGQRNESCDCTTFEKSGRTEFYKIRLNITSLTIIENVFTFTWKIIGEHNMNYGWAGDCYTKHKHCPQGEFLIDLRDTSFRLSKNVRWLNTGNLANSIVNIQDQVAQGRCGGQCGQCLPDPKFQLKVEVTENPTIPKY